MTRTTMGAATLAGGEGVSPSSSASLLEADQQQSPFTRTTTSRTQTSKQPLLIMNKKKKKKSSSVSLLNMTILLLGLTLTLPNLASIFQFHALLLVCDGGDTTATTNILSTHGREEQMSLPLEQQQQPHSESLLVSSSSSSIIERNMLRSDHITNDDSDMVNKCQIEFERLHQSQVSGLSSESLERSRTWIGNRQRLYHLARKLKSQQQPIQVVVNGGSITMGHGIDTPKPNRYSGQLEQWLNDNFPVTFQNNNNTTNKTTTSKTTTKHQVHTFGAHGADMCNLAKRIHIMLETKRKHFLLEELQKHPQQQQQKQQTMPHPQSVWVPDLFILEFAVNDYQGQDHHTNVHYESDVYFDGFQDIVLCCETIIYKLLQEYPHAAIVFLEFRTAIPSRRTAESLHLGIAQHYQIPIISYAEAMYPEYLHLLSLLDPTTAMSAPGSISFTPPNSTILTATTNDNSNSNDHHNTTTTTTVSPASSILLPYPYGCAPCQPQDIMLQFRKGYCKSICNILNVNNIVKCSDTNVPRGRQPCYPPIFAHDSVHPSKVGHQIAKDLLVHALVTSIRDVCYLDEAVAAAAAAKNGSGGGDGGGNDDDRNLSPQQPQPHIIPTTGWLTTSTRYLKGRANFDLVQDTMKMYSQRHDKLQPVERTSGWSLYSDTGEATNKKLGWIATTEAGHERISFDIHLPFYSCYAIYLAILKSYRGMGTFSVTIYDFGTNTTTRNNNNDNKLDGLWKAPISVWSDIPLTSKDDEFYLSSSSNNKNQTEKKVPVACTGHCRVTIETHPQLPGRDGNKVKLLTLSVRKCLEGN